MQTTTKFGVHDSLIFTTCDKISFLNRVLVILEKSYAHALIIIIHFHVMKTSYLLRVVHVVHLLIDLSLFHSVNLALLIALGKDLILT